MFYTYAKIPTKYGDWDLFLYVNTNGLDTSEIMARLKRIGCFGDMLDSAEENLIESKMDTGLTYSNISEQQSVMVISKTSSVAEFSNSYHHELFHLAQHIMQAFSISPWGEEAAYLAGDMASLLYPKIKRFLCSCRSCHHSVR